MASIRDTMKTSVNMNHYWLRLQDTAALLSELLGEIMPTLDGSKAHLVSTPIRESLTTRLGRKLGVVTRSAFMRQTAGYLVNGYEKEQLMVTRLSSTGEPALGSHSAGAAGEYTKFTPYDYLYDVVSVDRWVSSVEYDRRFVHLYETLATQFLPTNHPLQATAKSLREAITPKEDEEAVAKSS